MSNALCKSKDAGLKGHILYDSIYVTFWQKQSIGTKNRLVIIRVKGKKGLNYKGLAQCACGVGWVKEHSALITVLLSNSTFVKAHRTACQKEWVHCIHTEK